MKAEGGSFPTANKLIRFETPYVVSYNPVVNSWLLLQSGPGPAAFNMALDEALLKAMPRLSRPVLRFYGWTEPAATFGYFQKYADVERATRLRPLIRRPTGGGIVPHAAPEPAGVALLWLDGTGGDIRLFPEICGR